MTFSVVTVQENVVHILRCGNIAIKEKALIPCYNKNHYRTFRDITTGILTIQ